MRFFNLILMTSVLIFAGCDTDGPLSDPAASHMDEALLGHWSGVMEDSPLHIFIGRHEVKGNPASLVEVLGIQYDRKRQRFDAVSDSNGANPMPRLYASVTPIGSKTFLSVFYQGDDPADLSSEGSYDKWIHNAKKNCLTLHYQTDGKQLRFATLTGNDLEPAMKRGEVIQNDGLVSAASLVSYIEKSGGLGAFEFQPVQLNKQE